MYLIRGTCIVREWQAEDAPAIVRHADNRNIWATVRDRFPSPYTIADAQAWIRHCARTTPSTDFAIDVDGEAVGGIGLVLRDDIDRVSAEIGFWLGEAFWGRGITTDAVNALVPWAFDRFQLTRIYAQVFSSNARSARVLEKAGFVREGVLRKAAIKDGRLIDQLLFARIREDAPAASSS
jgi:RimJ/RimL family protein N-acetyltransferase